MKTMIHWTLLSALGTSALLQAESNTLTELKISYFYPSSKTLREIYGTGGVNYELAFSYYVWKDLAIRVAGDFFIKEGHSLNGDQKTRLEILPVSLGTFYAYRMGMHRLYGGGGLRYFFVKIKNDSSSVSSHSYGHGVGGYLEGGYLATFDDWFTFDLFANYSFRRLKLNSEHIANVEQTSVEVGGLNIGAGVGFKF